MSCEDTALRGSEKNELKYTQIHRSHKPEETATADYSAEHWQLR